MEINVVPEKKYMSFECTNSINGIDVHFVSHIQIRNKKDVTNLYNYLFYVDATSDVYEKFVRSFYENGFVNAIPIFDNSLLNRSKSYISLNLNETTLETIVNDLKPIAQKYEEDHKSFSIVNKFVFDSFIEMLEIIAEKNVNDINGKVLFIDFRNTLFNLHGIELRRHDSIKNRTPIISSYNVSEFLKVKVLNLIFLIKVLVFILLVLDQKCLLLRACYSDLLWVHIFVWIKMD